MSVTVYPKSTTIYKPELCFNGYTLFPNPVDGKWGVVLIDMNGRTAHAWKLESERMAGTGIPRARLLKNGHVLVLRTRGSMVEGAVQEYDWNDELVWEYFPSKPHHDIFRKDNGNTLVICREDVPEKIRNKAKDPARREVLYADVVLEITPHNEVVWEWHQYEHIDIDRCQRIPASRDWWAGPDNNTVTDWTHTNTVQALPENKWHDQGDKRFRPGNVLLSLRQIDLLLIVDSDSKEIAWEYTGDYRGGLSGQHDSHMVEKGVPGEGNIVVFDNGTSPERDLAHAGCSYVLEVNPVTKKVVWTYENGERFHSNYTSSCQRLANGNTLINEAAGGRIFEVTRECEIVWEYVYQNKRSSRAYRYPYDYCAPIKELGQPKETPVIPPEDMLGPPEKK